MLPLVLQGGEGAAQVSRGEQSEFLEYESIKTGSFLSSEDENKAPSISPQSSRLARCAHLNLWRFHQCDCVSLIRERMCGTLTSLPPVSHFSFVMEDASLYVWGKICKTKQIRVVGYNKGGEEVSLANEGVSSVVFK